MIEVRQTAEFVGWMARLRDVRVYYVQRGAVLVVLLCGGDKGSQSWDISTAKRLAAEL